MKEKLTEITRSFTRKINLGNFESVDLFCAQKMEVPLKDAEKTSQELFEFCRNEVENAEAEIRMNGLYNKLAKTKLGQESLKSEKENEMAQDSKRPPIKTERPFISNQDMD